MQAQFWPHLFGVIPGSDAKSAATLAALNGIWSGVARPDWAAQPEKANGGWISSDIAYGALLAGERRRIPTYLDAVNRLKISGPNRFAWPFTAADAGLLLALSAADVKH